MNHAAVLGPGRIGRQIALVFALGGSRVSLVDVKERPAGGAAAVFADARREIRRDLALMAEEGVIQHDEIAPALDRIEDRIGLDGLDECGYVQEALPELVDLKRAILGRVSTGVSPQANPIIKETQAIYRENFFPEVKVDWRTYPDFVGHKNWNGCFRCHDGKHVAADGKVSIKASDCRSCHLILAQGSGEALEQINAKGHDFIHTDAPYAEFSCVDCDTGGPQK